MYIVHLPYFGDIQSSWLLQQLLYYFAIELLLKMKKLLQWFNYENVSEILLNLTVYKLEIKYHNDYHTDIPSQSNIKVSLFDKISTISFWLIRTGRLAMLKQGLITNQNLNFETFSPHITIIFTHILSVLWSVVVDQSVAQGFVRLQRLQHCTGLCDVTMVWCPVFETCSVM